MVGRFKEDTVVIFGGSGYIGMNLATTLARRFRTVLSVSRHACPGLGPTTPDNIEFVQADVAKPEAYEALLHKADVILYLASSTTPGSCGGDPRFEVMSNLVPFVGLLDANRQIGSATVMFVSSGGTVYGEPNYLPIDENHPTNPISPYGAVKLAMEKYLGLYGKVHGMPYRILRLSNPYGGGFHNRSDQGVINVFIKKARNGEGITLWGDGNNVRDYVHMRDVCSSVDRLMDYDGAEVCFNIGSGIGQTINDLLAIIQAVSGHSFQIQHLPARGFDLRSNVLDITRAQRELSWSPTVSLEAGIRELVKVSI